MSNFWTKNKAIPIGLAFLLGVLPACGGASDNSGTTEGNTPENTQPPAAATNPIYDNKPVTIKFYSGNTDEDWKTYIEDPIKKKFPNVTLVRVVQQQSNLAQLVAANDIPDIITVTPNVFVSDILPLQLQYDMSELIKKYKFDTNRIASDIMADIQAYGDKGQIYGLPLQSSLYGLLYNKDLFDKFNVPYPKDNMTWDDAIDLAKRLSRTDNGVSYRGLELHLPLQMFSQLSLNPITKDDKAMVTTPQWQTVLQKYKAVYDVQGNTSPVSGSIANYYKPFYEGSLGMLAISTIRMMSSAKDYPQLNWDVVTYPTFKEAPNTGPLVNYVLANISSTSKVKDEAFEILSYLLSDEVMTQFVRIGYITPLKNTDIHKQMGADVPSLRGKNLSSMYSQKQASFTYSKYYSAKVTNLMNSAFNSVRQGQKDINTALREAEEAIQKEIDQLKAQ